LNKNTFSTNYENKFLMTAFQQAINKSVSNSCSSFYNWRQGSGMINKGDQPAKPAGWRG